MASIVVTDVKIMNNPSGFMENFAFEVSFECLSQISENLEWKMMYINGADTLDRVLDVAEIGPVSVGTNKFVFAAEPPNPYALTRIERIGAVVLSGSYKEKEFIRVGYFVNNEYIESDDEMLEGQKKVQIEASFKEEEEEEEPNIDDLPEEDETDDINVNRDEADLTSLQIKTPLPTTHKTPTAKYIYGYPQRIQRNIIIDKPPRVVSFQIDWN